MESTEKPNMKKYKYKINKSNFDASSTTISHKISDLRH
jgi:hypothetical protein